MERLLEKGANADLHRIKGATPLSWAILHGHRQVVQLLLTKGAEAEPKYENIEAVVLLCAA